jgi:hypothetical protein
MFTGRSTPADSQAAKNGDIRDDISPHEFATYC